MCSSGQPALDILDRVIEGNARTQFLSLQPKQKATIEQAVENLCPMISPIMSPTAAALKLCDLKQRQA